MRKRGRALRSTPAAIGFVTTVTSVLTLSSIFLSHEALGTELQDWVITHATVMTASHGTLADTSVWVHAGKIAAVGSSIAVPPGAAVIDATNETLTPGIIDAHSHAGESIFASGAAHDEANELTGPFQPQLRIRDGLSTESNEFYELLAAGQTAQLVLPGSGNIVGGQAMPLKIKIGRPREEWFIKDAPISMKTACGDTPSRVYGARGQEPSTPAQTSMMRRAEFDKARAYAAEWDRYRDAVKAGKAGKTGVSAPSVDLEMEALNGILNGTTLVHIHCHTAEQISSELAIAKDYGYTIRAIHHASEAYKIADQLAAAGTAALIVVDWYADTGQAHENIPWGAAIDRAAGVRVALHGEALTETRHLPIEAGKLMRYAGYTRDEALAAITLNSAWIMGLDKRIGSIDVGKDADLVLWRGDPLSVYGRVQKVFIDGELSFDSSLPGLGLPSVGPAQ
jgi:imidazolonepropionase-like amidohydrolase